MTDPRDRRSPPVRPAPGKAAASKADADALLQSLHEQLRQAVDALESGAQWQAWLRFSQRLHRYSFNNLILIWCQRPESSQVAGYNTWHSLGRQVRRGEKAIRVLAPVTRRAPVLNVDGTPHHEPDGTPSLRRQIVGFRAAPVFDISQTDGPPLPIPASPELLIGASPNGLWERLVAQVSDHDYQLHRGPIDQLGGANGLTKVPEKQVWIRNDVTPLQATKTLAHELAHIMLHVDNGVVAGCRGIIEVEAESVAHLVLGAHQIDTSSYTFPYVAAWAQPVAEAEQVPMAEIVARTGARVVRAADQIITAATIGDTIATGRSADPLAPVAARAANLTAAVVELSEQAPATTVATAPDRSVLFAIVADSHEFYQSHVQSSWVPEYLTGRALIDALEPKQLGYAPAGWTGLVDHLRSLGYTDTHIEAAGMATRARTGRLIDRMRDRLIIPLRDPFGAVVGFTGRRAPYQDHSPAPKYLNTPTTPIFDKSTVLYGLWENRRGLDYDSPVVCEGPLDAIAIDLLAGRHRMDVFGVAACGTAFTDNHADLLRSKLLDRQQIYLGFDADDTGVKATERTWRSITNASWWPATAVELDDGRDPAALFTEDPNRLREAISQARPAGIVVASRQIKSADLAGNVAKEVAAFRDLYSWSERVPPGERDDYLQMLKDTLRIDQHLAGALIAENGRTYDATPKREVQPVLNLPVVRVDGSTGAARANNPEIATESWLKVLGDALPRRRPEVPTWGPPAPRGGLPR